MAVKITELCINCDSCIDECPATAIVSASDSPVNGDNTYVKPEKCIECSDGTMPKCADACPTEGAIVWDMPYTAEYNAYYVRVMRVASTTFVSIRKMASCSQKFLLNLTVKRSRLLIAKHTLQ